jgi:hypothetical protein
MMDPNPIDIGVEVPGPEYEGTASDKAPDKDIGGTVME